MLNAFMDSKVVTCSGPVNIAVIKYWGKKDEVLIIPLNSSLSVTLDQNELRATTSVMLSSSFTQDKIWINGKEESISNPRLLKCLEEVRRLSKEQHPDSFSAYDGSVHICSENNFPTAAGLASSAAGYACLVFALSKLYEIEGDISAIARQGSGSACRSVYGGFVKWERGERTDGKDSIAVQVAPARHWPELEVLVLVVSAEKKSVSSTSGMQTTVMTSSLIQHRADVIVPSRMEQMEQAILQRNFETFAKLTMQDSNQFHAVCLDTYPPIFYLNDVSRRIVKFVTLYNEMHKQTKVAYTFDAGPNAVLYALAHDVPHLLDCINQYFPPADETSVYFKGLSAARKPNTLEEKSVKDQLCLDPMPGSLQYIIHTKAGEGPQLLASDEQNCLLDKDGLPKFKLCK